LTENGKRAFLQKLGLCRRAGEAIIGQDRIRSTISEGKGPLLLLFSKDASPSVRRRLAPSGSRSLNRAVLLETISRQELGAALGIFEAQVVALPGTSRFAEMLLEDLRQEGDRIE